MLKIPFTETYIDFKSFLAKKTPPIDSTNGVYCISGFQGSGKSYYGVFLAKELSSKYKVYSNIHSLTFEHTDFTKISEAYSNFEPNTLFLIDEISNKYRRETPTDQKFYRWLQQTRKRKSVVILLTQEWKELPTWLRRPVKVHIATSRLLLSSLTGLFKTVYGDGENLHWDQTENDYVCPPIKTVIHKRNMRVASLYDTFEPIAEL